MNVNKTILYLAMHTDPKGYVLKGNFLLQMISFEEQYLYSTAEPIFSTNICFSPWSHYLYGFKYFVFHITPVREVQLRTIIRNVSLLDGYS
jgi:hypothetical protein